MIGNGNEMYYVADVAYSILHATFRGIDACYVDILREYKREITRADQLMIVQFYTIVLWDNHVAYFERIQRWHT
jgi:hypothetical protein